MSNDKLTNPLTHPLVTLSRNPGVLKLFWLAAPTIVDKNLPTLKTFCDHF